jgi:hypothetical protein
LGDNISAFLCRPGEMTVQNFAATAGSRTGKQSFGPYSTKTGSAILSGQVCGRRSVGKGTKNGVLLPLADGGLADF